MRATRSRFSAVTIVWFAAAAFGLLAATAQPVRAQWIPYSSNPRNILEGNWQSCLDKTGRYAERVYDHVVNGVGQFEVHLGPRDEFAVFVGVQDEHREHASPANLLQPYRLEPDAGRATRRWELRSLGLAFTATLAGGSRSDCESWFVLLEPLRKPSH